MQTIFFKCFTLKVYVLPILFYRKYILWTSLIIAGMTRMIADISSRSAMALFINNSVYPKQAGRVNGLAFSVQEIMR